MVNSEHCHMYLKKTYNALQRRKRPNVQFQYQESFRTLGRLSISFPRKYLVKTVFTRDNNDKMYQFLVVNWLTRKDTAAKQLAFHEFLMAETSSFQVTDRNITKAAFAPGVIFIPPRVTLYYAQIQ